MMDALKVQGVSLLVTKQPKFSVDWIALNRVINSSRDVMDDACTHESIRIVSVQKKRSDEIESEYANCNLCGVDVKYKT